MKLTDKKTKELTIQLRPPSALDPLTCPDGEIQDGARYFPETGNGEGDNTENDPKELNVTKMFDLPEGVRVICLHRIDAPEPKTHAILAYPDGKLRYLDMAATARGARDLSYTPVEEIIKGTGVSDFLVFITEDALTCARWDRTLGRYVWLGKCPAPPAPKWILSYRPLEPYSSYLQERPRIEVEVALPEDDGDAAVAWLAGRDVTACPEAARRTVRKAVGERFSRFLEDVAAAGLHFSRHYAAAAWLLRDGTRWNHTPPFIVGPDADPEGKITKCEYAVGTLWLTLELSRSPYSLEVADTASALPEAWNALVTGVTLVAGKGGGADVEAPSSPGDPVWLDAGSRGFRFPRRPLDVEYALPEDVMQPIDARGVPSDIAAVGGRLFAVYRKGDGRDVNLLAVSATAFPFAASGVGEIAGGRLLTVEHSLRSLSSGQLGDFPLYAFASDGIRALTPSGGGFRDVQLISRDVPVDPGALAPMEDGLCMVSPRGVLRLAGASVTCLSASLETKTEWTRDDRIAYLYAERSLVVYRDGEAEAYLYSFADSRWTVVPWNAAAGGERNSYVAWPETYFTAGGHIGMPEIVTTTGISARSIGEAGAVPFATRPIKFGSPFREKKLLYVEAVWPDSVARQLTVYGANHLGKWHCLGRSESGRMRLRGSGWRYFRFESYLKRELTLTDTVATTYLKPLLHCIVGALYP